MDARSHEVVMYSRPGCHLCDAAREGIAQLRRVPPFTFEEVSIEGDDELERRYGLRIPVVMVDGEELFEFEVNLGLLEAVLSSDSQSR